MVDGKGTHGGYCGPAVKPIALNMVAEIARDPETRGLPISGIGGIEDRGASAAGPGVGIVVVSADVVFSSVALDSAITAPPNGLLSSGSAAWPPGGDISTGPVLSGSSRLSGSG